MTFEEWNRALRFMPSWIRCLVHAHLPHRLQQPAWTALADEVAEKRRIARESGFVHISEPLQAELERLRPKP